MSDGQRHSARRQIPIPPPFPHIYGEKGHSFFSPFPSDAQSSYIIVFIPMWGERGRGDDGLGLFFFFRPASFWGRLKEDRGRKHIMLIMALMQEPLSGGKGKGGVGRERLRCGEEKYRRRKRCNHFPIHTTAKKIVKGSEETPDRTRNGCSFLYIRGREKRMPPQR